MAFDSFSNHSQPIETLGQSGESLSQHAFALTKHDHELRDVGIAAGTGFIAGGALTAAGEYGLMKAFEPAGRMMGVLAFSMLGAGRFAGDIATGPALTAAECITPKYVLAGGLIAAGVVAGGYEFYKHLYENQ